MSSPAILKQPTHWVREGGGGEKRMYCVEEGINTVWASGPLFTATHQGQTVRDYAYRVDVKALESVKLDWNALLIDWVPGAGKETKLFKLRESIPVSKTGNLTSQSQFA